MNNLDTKAAASNQERLGILFVFLSAFFWSIGGAIARFIETPDSWTVVFWRSVWAAAFLIAYMIWRDGLRGTVALFRGMGIPGLAVAACFGVCSTSFVVALSYTTVANILLMQAGVPLFAALLAFILFGEKVAPTTWAAIAAVIFGVAIMVSESLTGKVSPIGDGLALVIAIGFSIATVITRRFAHVRMTPATCLGTVLAILFSFSQATSLATTAADAGLLFAFGAINLGVGLAFFATGARMVPAALAALIGTFEPILGPIWVWLVHGEVPSQRTLIGGGIVLAALIVYLTLEFRRRAGSPRLAVAVGP
jgi:drug/metabolite transporter (DMT)-like permease